MLEALLSAAFDATPEKLEAARAPLAASLLATSLQAARCAPLMAPLFDTTCHRLPGPGMGRLCLHWGGSCSAGERAVTCK